MIRAFAVSLLPALICACCGGGNARPAGDTTPDNPPADTAPAVVTDTSTSHTASVVSGDTISDVITRYYGAINARDYPRAYLMWGDSGRSSGQSYDAFAKGFAQTKQAEVELGAAGRVEGAAGSRYVEVPVTVVSTQTDGSVKCFAGTYTLRRVVVDGATAAQRAWHIDSASMHETACPPQ
jgi:hypothetical protein